MTFSRSWLGPPASPSSRRRKAAGPNLTRQALISQLQQIHNWTGGGVTPQVDIGNKVPSKCFFYLKIENGAYQRVYPSAANTYDCSGGFFQY
jgi:hypothetical protein